tara:strand:+ start:192 stop:686 length:495 start_codon:yes stop_codon:yes gene_type:complete
MDGLDQDPDPIRAVELAGASLLIIGFAGCTYAFYTLFTPSQPLGPANYALHSFTLQMFGGIMLVIAAAEPFSSTVYELECERFGDILLCIGAVILVVHLAVSREATLVSIFTKKDMKLAKAKFIYSTHQLNYQKKAQTRKEAKEKEKQPDEQVDVVVIGAGPVI